MKAHKVRSSNTLSEPLQRRIQAMPKRGKRHLIDISARAVPRNLNQNQASPSSITFFASTERKIPAGRFKLREIDLRLISFNLTYRHCDLRRFWSSKWGSLGYSR